MGGGGWVGVCGVEECVRVSMLCSRVFLNVIFYVFVLH